MEPGRSIFTDQVAVDLGTVTGNRLHILNGPRDNTVVVGNALCHVIAHITKIKTLFLKVMT